MAIPIEQKSGYTVVYLKGEVDLNRSPEARKAILGCLQKKDNLMVDLSAVDYIDSSGIACLVEGYQVSRKQQLDFALVGVSDSAMRVLQLARLDKVFPIYSSIEARLSDNA